MTNQKLTDAELAEYDEKGWIVPTWELPAALLEDMREEYLALLERNQHLQSDIMMAPHQTNGGSMGVIGSEKWLEYATHPSIVSTASQ
ncbi:MAG: hypothetical protein ACPF94_01120, partial [Candidatus Puniceispirillales bacterium]